MKEKILFIYDSMMTGGTSTALLSLLNTIDRERYEISLLLFTNTGALMGEIPEFVRLLEPAYRESGFLNVSQKKILRTVLNGKVFSACKARWRYRNTPKGNFRHILMHYGMAAQVSLSRCVEEQFDYAIGFMEGWANEYVVSSRIKAKKKFVWIHPQYHSCYLIPEIDRKTLSRVDGIALVSENCLEPFFAFFPECREKTQVVPNILSSQLVREKAGAADAKIEKAALNFCTVCRCDVQVKGLDRLLKVFYTLKKEGLTPNVRWHLIGGGGSFSAFQKEVERLGMQDTVILYGNQQNPLIYLRQMDAFVLASRYEGKPVSVTEAQILGIPCMVTDYASASGQIRHNVDGWIMGNNYESIYEAVKAVIQTPSLLEKWKRNTVSASYGNEGDIAAFYRFIRMTKSK